MFNGVFEKTNPAPMSAPVQPVPFTIQKELLAKYLPNLKIGLCRSLSNVYAKKVLQGHNPTLLLENDRDFLNEAIKEENVETRLRKEGLSEEDASYLAFTMYSTTPETRKTVPAGQMNEVLDEVLEKHDHVLLNLPTSQADIQHQVYFGRDNTNFSNSKTFCRFFDANLRRGERVNYCPELLKDFKKHLDLNYPTDKKPSSLSAIPHPRM